MSKSVRRTAGALLILASVTASAGTIVGASSVPAASTDATIDLGVPEPEVGDRVAGPTAAIAARTTATSTTKPRTTTVSSSATGLFGMTPVRLVDTRPSVALVRGEPLIVPIAGLAGVPSTAVAAVVNLTITGPTGEGFVTASPCGAPYGTSTLNFRRGQTIANLALVGLGTGGAICITASVEAHVIVDISGYVGRGGQLFSPLGPVRILDTRPAVAVEPNVPTVVRIAGSNGVPPTGVTATSINLTITAPAAEGYAIAYPCGTEIPLASNVNFAKGQTAAANGVIVGLDGSGSVCIVSSVRAHLIVDLTGWFGVAGAEVHPAAPTRLLDTRAGAGRVEAGDTLRVFAAPGALGTVINVTVTEAAAAGYLTVYPCGEAMPATSALNFGASQTIANAVLAPVNTSGYVCITPSATTNVIVDRTAVLGMTGTGDLASTGSVVTDWALTQVGDVYAAMNPYRFGDSKYGKAWDCETGMTTCSKVDTQGKTRTTTAGAYVYDCSGLVVAAWLRAGIDLVKLGASWTEPMLTKLPQVTRETAQVGDLVMFDFDPTDADPVDHVGLYISPTEMVHAGTCAGGTSAVCRTTINWKNVTAILRPTTA